MKRSAQIGLVVMGALGVTTASGYYLAGRDQACQTKPPASAGTPGASAPENVAPGQPAANCGGSRWWGSGSGSSWRSSSGHSIWPAASSAQPARTSTAPTKSSSTTTAQRGGFGSTGHGIAASS